MISDISIFNNQFNSKAISLFTSMGLLLFFLQVMAIGRVGDRIIHLMADKVSKNGKITITRKKSRSQSWKVEVEYPKGEEKGKKNGKGKQIKKGWWWNNN